MASGKSAVGRELAALLGWSFRDFDARIEEQAGRSIPEIFRDDGEARFRELEADVGRRLLGMDRAVLAPGGGWPAGEGRMQGLPPGTLAVWLRVSPEEALRRARADGIERPLLAGEDALERARELLERRTPHYRRASLILDSESAPPENLAAEIFHFIQAERARREPAPS